MATFMHNDFTIENIEMFWLNVQKIALKNNGGYDLRSFHLKLLFEIQTQSRPERPKIKLCSEKSLIFFEMNLVIKHLSCLNIIYDVFFELQVSAVWKTVKKVPLGRQSVGPIWKVREKT